MFLRNLMKLRPESSIFLATAVALGAAVACQPASENNDPPFNPTGGGSTAMAGMPGTSTTGGTPGTTTTTGGMPGTTTQPGMPGTSTTGGMPGTSTTGGIPGTSTTGGMPGTSTTGGMPGTSTTGAAGGGDAGVDGGSPGGTGGASMVKGTAGSCLSVQAAAGGKCGSYYCNLTQAQIMPEIDTTKPCGKDSTGVTNADVYAYACEASLPKVVTDCAVAAAVGGILGGNAAQATRDCVKRDSSVSSKKVSDACIDCFGAVATCCSNNDACFNACLAGPSKACDDAQKAANCLKDLWSCSGLPNPL